MNSPPKPPKPTGADTYISMTVREKYHYGQVKYQEGFKAGVQMGLSINQTAIPAAQSITHLPIPHVSIPNLPIPNLPIPHLSIPNLPIPQISTPTIALKSDDIPPPCNNTNSILLDTTKAAKSIKKQLKAKTKAKKKTDSDDVEVLDLSKADIKTLQYFGLVEKEVEHAMYHVFKHVTLNKKTLSKKMNKKVTRKLRKVWQLLGNNEFFIQAGKGNRNHYNLNMSVYFNDAGNLKPLNRLHFMYPVDKQVANIYERVRKTIDAEICADRRQLLKQTKGNKNNKNNKNLSQIDMNNGQVNDSVVKDICLDSECIDVQSDNDKKVNKKRIIEELDGESESEKENKYGMDDGPPKKKIKLNIVNCDEEPTNSNSAKEETS